MKSYLAEFGSKIIHKNPIIVDKKSLTVLDKEKRGNIRDFLLGGLAILTMQICFGLLIYFTIPFIKNSSPYTELLYLFIWCLGVATGLSALLFVKQK